MEFLIDAIETSEHEEEFMEAFTPLILAFNHHFVGKERRTNVSVYATAHLLLPLPNINSKGGGRCDVAQILTLVRKVHFTTGTC